MKKIFSFTKKKKQPSGTPDSESVLSVGYDLKEKDLGKVHKAASVGDLAKLKQLAKKNDINQLDKENRTALHIACASGHVEVVQFLVESKAKLNLCDNQNRSALMKAVQGQNERCVNILLENHADPNLGDVNGNTALHLTANIPSISTAVLLLKYEANINAQNKEGFTPLTVAVREDHIEMTEFLLKEGADVNLLDQDQRSPLMIAAGNGQIGMLRMLLQFNADILLKDTKGWSAENYAVVNGHHPCSLLIIEHGTQRNDGSSLSHQALSKKKKTMLLGSPSQDAEVGFSLGGPATDKDDFEDNSQSESLSRVSKSAADEWPSSEDDDESVLIEKKLQKVNLRKMIASKKGEDSTAEQGSSNHAGQLSSSKGRSVSHKQSQEVEDEVVEEDEEDEEEEDDDDEDDDDDDDEDYDDDDEDEADDDDEEEEEENEDDEEESEEDDGEEDREENEFEEKHDNNSMASVDANTTDFEPIKKPSIAGALKIIDSADTQIIPGTDFPFSNGSNLGNVETSEKDAKTENTEFVSQAGTASYTMPARLNVEEDYVVSAIRVESKFSDEDDSLGKECMWSSDQNIIANLGSTGGLIPFKNTEIHAPRMVKEDEFEGKDDHDGYSWCNNENSGDTLWNDSDGEEDNQIGGFGRNTVLANRRNVLPEVDADKTDSDSESKKKEEKRRSSWGSSMEDSDTDLPKEDGVNKETLDQNIDVQASDLHTELAVLHLKSTLSQPNETQPDPSLDLALVASPKQMTDEPRLSSGLCSPGFFPSKNRIDKDESEWDSSENNDQSDKKKMESIVSQTKVTGSQSSEQQCLDGSWEEENKDIERESNNPSPVVSPTPEDENPTNQRLDIDDVESVGQSSEKEEIFDSENEKSDDSNWDDEDESDESEKKSMNTKNHEVAEFDDVSKINLSTPANLQSPELRPTSAVDKRLQDKTGVDGTDQDKKVPQPVIDGNFKSPEYNRPEAEKKKVGIKKDSPSKDGQTSEDSDSKDQTLQHDFVSAQVSDVGDDYDNTLSEPEARLTAYLPLENTSAIISQAMVSSDDLDEDPNQEKILCSPPTKDLHYTDGNIFSHEDEVLPQTEIDDVDLDSPDDAESIGISQEHRDIEEHIFKKEDSTENEENEDEEREEEEDISDENDQLEESGDSHDAASAVHDTEISKDKKRDFLSELGLEKEQEEQDSWDSESHSDNPSMLHEEKQHLNTQDPDEISAGEEEIKKIDNGINNDNGGNHVDKDDTVQKEADKAKWEPLSVLSKLEGDNDQKTDLMEELGLGDVDDLDDASDWDSTSTTSKRTLPGRRLAASPGLEEFPEICSPSFKENDKNIIPAAPLTPQRIIVPDYRLTSTPSQVVPTPQPQPRKMVQQKPESEEESDWEADHLTSCNTAKIGNKHQNIAELHAAKPGSPELSSMESDHESNIVANKQQQMECDAVDSCELDHSNLWPSGHVGSGTAENDHILRDQCSSEERAEACDDAPWEKRYENLWVEVEKREMKSTFKNVAGELKEKFGELFKLRCPAEDVTEEQQGMAGCISADNDSSDDEEGEVIVRPTARMRSTVLLTIPEQRESGLEDSVTESTDNSLCEDRMEVSERTASESNILQKPLPLTDVAKENCSPPVQLTTVEIETNKRAIPFSDVDCSSVLKYETELRPVPKQQMDLIWKDTTTHVDEANKNNMCSEEDLEEFAKYRPPSIHRYSTSVPGVSEEELAEDMERFKFEVGMLKVVFLDLAKEKAQLRKETGKETPKAAIEVQKSSASWDTRGTALEEVGSEKPETSLGCLSRQAGQIHQEQQPAAIKRTSGVPVQLLLPFQQTYNSNKQEGKAVEGTLQLELVKGARHAKAPQTNDFVNGDPLSVFDDSTLSDVSDDEGRLPASGQTKNENPEEVEMAEDFDELTQSSDTATEDNDSPTSGYRHASLLIQKLDSATLDSRTMVKLQNIFHEYERSIQKARSRHGYLADKVSQLEMERVELRTSLEEVKDVKSDLERNQLELQTEVTNLKFQLKQEQENRRNSTMMYNTTRDKLRRTEEQHQLEVQERQKVELTLRNLELEMRTLVNNTKQLEEDHSEIQRLLAQERSARTLQENLLNSHLRKQQEIEEENKRNISKSNEALSQLTEASDRERELVQQTVTLQEQLNILRTDLEHSRANSSLKESHILEENEALKEQLEDARRDLKLSSEALTQTVFNCNNQMTTLKSELAITTTRLENERQTRETLEAEIESARSRLAGAIKETERCLAAHSDTEKALLREKDEHQRLRDRLTGEAANQREAISSMSQKLAKAETQANSMENEVHRVTLQLTEKGLLLEGLQREKDQAAARIKELESALQAERELVSRAGARQEAAQERLAQAQSEGMLLRQQLEETQNKGAAKERAVTDAQERFSDILSKLRSDCEERVQLVEERNKELASKAADLRDQIYKLEEEKSERETSLRQLQQELADSLKKLSMSEATLEVNTRYRNDLEEEKARLLKDVDRLKAKLEESEDQYVQAERRINSLKNSLDEREKELATAAQKLQEALSASAASDITIKQLEEAVQGLEIENARLEAAAKQQSNKIDALQKGAHEAAMVRGHLEDLVTNLQSSKMTLEDQLSREVQKQSMLSHTAHDSQALWEEELKSRSKLGLRLAELEKEKGELNTQMEIEKKKAKKIAEQKKAIDTRLDQEMKRNTELQKEMYRLRTLLKTAKKKLRDQDTGGAEFSSPMSSLRMDLGRHGHAESAIGRMKEKVDDLQVQLENEVSHRRQLEKVNGELKDQLASVKCLSRSNDLLERSKRQLEEEVLDLRRRMETSQMEQSQVDQFRRDAEERARQELQQKLEQVNLFLQSQAASQEALDQIKATNEATLRSQLEHKIHDLEGELGRTRTTQQDSLNQRDSLLTELERYQQLYTEELRLRKSLTAKLERSNNRLAEANSKLLNEQSRSYMTSSIANGSLGGPTLDLGTLGSPSNYGATLGPLNRSLGLGFSLRSPVTEGQNSRVEDYLAKMQSELDRNISKELNNATAELDVASARLSPVGSASRVELDPVSRATQQYLEVLKKNNMI